MWWLLISASLVGLAFLIGSIKGAPYLPTLQRQIDTALDLLDLKQGQLLLELGAGDGRVIKAAAIRGWRVIGYEINPLLWLVATLRCWRYRETVRVHCANMLASQLPEETSGVFIFGIERIMTRLSQKLQQELPKGTRIASFAFQLHGLTLVKTSNGIYLYQL